MAREFRAAEPMSAEQTLAATPGAEVVNMNVSLAADDKRNVVITADVARAYFSADTERRISVDIQHEAGEVHVCGLDYNQTRPIKSKRIELQLVPTGRVPKRLIPFSEFRAFLVEQFSTHS